MQSAAVPQLPVAPPPFHLPGAPATPFHAPSVPVQTTPEWTADPGLAGLVILGAIAYVVLVAVTIAMGAVVLNLPGPNLVLAPLFTLLGLGAMVGTWWRGR